MQLTSAPARPVTPAEIHTYREEGAVFLRRVLDPHWIEFLHLAVHEALANPGPQAEEYTPAGQPGRFSATSIFGSGCPSSVTLLSVRRRRRSRAV